MSQRVNSVNGVSRVDRRKSGPAPGVACVRSAGSERGGRLRRCARVALAVGLTVGLLGAESATAADPVRLSAEGVVRIDESTEASLIELSREAAAREAVYQLAQQYVPEERRITREEELRAALGPRALGLVTQLIPEGAERRPDPEDPLQQQYVARFSLTVDGERLRALLREQGWIQRGPTRPSVVLRVLSGDGLRSAPLLELARFLEEALRGEGYPLVEASLFPGPSAERGSESAAELGRRLGADVAVDVTVRTQAVSPRDSLSVGGVRAEVSFNGVLAADVTEVAIGTLPGTGYNRDRTLALSTALQGVRGQVAQNLLFQLNQNIAALSPAASALRLRLAGVTSLLQVELVQRALVERLGVRTAQLSLLEPSSAELIIDGPFSAGVLQERLAGLVFDGFQLQVQGVQPQEVSMRVLSLGQPLGASPADRQGDASEIDTRSADG